MRNLDPTTNTKPPLPQQLLSLLPKDPPKPWPSEFVLARDFQKMKNMHSFLERNKAKLRLSIKGNSANTVETASEDYPALRRSRRLSYMVWVLVEEILTKYNDILTAEKMVLTKQDILEMTSISQRLYAAKNKLEDIILLLK